MEQQRQSNRRRATRTKWGLGATSLVATVGLMAQMGPLTAGAATNPELAAESVGATLAVIPPTSLLDRSDEDVPLGGLAMAAPTGPPPADFGGTSTIPGRPRRSAATGGGVEEPAWAASLTTTTTTTTAAPRPKAPATTAPPATAPPATAAPETTTPATAPPVTAAPTTAPQPPPPPPTTESSG